MRVLVTSSRNTFALDIIRKLGSIGHAVVASDTYAGAIGNHSRFADAYEVTASPRTATDQFVTDVSRIVGDHDVDVIVPGFEEAFFLAARSADLPEGVRLFTGTFDKLARLHDKTSFQRLAAAANVPVPETLVATTADELTAAIARYPQWFARAAFSRGGVGLLTNTGPLAGKASVADIVPTRDQPWLVQPFLAGPMVCSYSIVVDGKITAHCTYRAPEQWAHSTGIAFLAVDSAQTLADAQRLVSTLDPHYTGQLSFDFVDHAGTLYAIECNPRPTSGVILLNAEEFGDALSGDGACAVVAPGVERQVRLAVVADSLAEPLGHLPTALRDVVHVRDIGSGWHDELAMMWLPATLIHAAELSRGQHAKLLEALGEDIVWNGEQIAGMTDADAACLQDVHAQRM